MFPAHVLSATSFTEDMLTVKTFVAILEINILGYFLALVMLGNWLYIP